MKKALWLSLLLIPSAQAFDYKINIESRMDVKHQKSKSAGNSINTIENNSNFFEGSLVRINMMGKINEDLTYRVRYRVNVNSSSQSKDKTTSSLDHAYIDHKNRFFTARIGKTYFNESFARESMNSSTDLFLRTQAYQSYNEFIGTYKTGVAAIFSGTYDQKIIFSISNSSPENQDTTGSKTNTHLGYGFFYTARFFSDYFQPILSINIAPQDNDVEANKTSATHQLIALGFKSQVNEEFSFEADWKEMRKEKSTTPATEDDGITRSLMTLANYDIDQLTPFVGYVHDKFNADLAEKSFKKNSYVAGVKWKPFDDLNFRYHLYFSEEKTKYEQVMTGVQSQKNHIYAFGFKADI